MLSWVSQCVLVVVFIISLQEQIHLASLTSTVFTRLFFIFFLSAFVHQFTGTGDYLMRAWLSASSEWSHGRLKEFTELALTWKEKKVTEWVKYFFPATERYKVCMIKYRLLFHRWRVKNIQSTMHAYRTRSHQLWPKSGTERGRESEVDEKAAQRSASG